jgi:hypothetical protein
MDRNTLLTNLHKPLLMFSKVANILMEQVLVLLQKIECKNSLTKNVQNLEHINIK